MTKRQTPPGLMSKALVVVVNPFGPHHCARCLGSVHASHTRWRGALNRRVPINARGSSSRSRLFFTPTLLLLRLQFTQIIIQPIEARLPEAAITLEPVVNALQCRGFDAARTPLRLAAARDQARALTHLEMLGNGAGPRAR